jgi:hypothetical protein
MKKQNKWVSFLIPVIAVVVLAESVMLISSLSGQNVVNKSVNVAQPEVTVMPTAAAVQPAVFGVTVATPDKEMILNKAETVEVKSVGNSDRFLDSVNVYLKYDPTAFEISNLTFDKVLPAPAFSKVSQTTGLIVANFLISAPAGLKISSGQVLSLMKFSAKPIKTGDFGFEISTGNGSKESVTMFVESVTSKILPFTANKLTVSVSR